MVRDTLKVALSRARYAAMGAAIGAAIGGLVSRNAASSGAAVGALIGASVGETRLTARKRLGEARDRGRSRLERLVPA